MKDSSIDPAQGWQHEPPPWENAKLNQHGYASEEDCKNPKPNRFRGCCFDGDEVWFYSDTLHAPVRLRDV
jgi:hypothetical protein